MIKTDKAAKKGKIHKKSNLKHYLRAWNTAASFSACSSEEPSMNWQSLPISGGEESSAIPFSEALPELH